MQRTALMFTMLGAWALAIIYDRIKVNTGVEVGVLLYASIITMVVGMYRFWRTPKETDEREA